MIAVVGQMSSNEAGDTTDAQPCNPEPHVQEAEVTFSFSLTCTDGIKVGLVLKRLWIAKACIHLTFMVVMLDYRR